MSEQIGVPLLGRLLNNLHRITGLKFALMDFRANEIHTSSYMNEFCECMQDTEAGYRRCVMCDAEQLRELRPDGTLKQYRCHAGLIEIAIPVTENGQIIATVLLGQLLSDEDIGAQWVNTRRLCNWHHDRRALERAFFKLRRISADDIQACAEIALACVSEVRFRGLIEASTMTEFQRLSMFIDQHYMEKLSLDVLSHTLHIGKTKLCNLARHEAGVTLTQMIADKRVAVAGGMLVSTLDSVQQIADAVGIPDCNYFAKVFKKQTGDTPLQYRKRHRSLREQSRGNPKHMTAM